MKQTKDSSVRVRFAPSPTGHLHIGSLRTALFNWLFARHYGGTFLVRIEDTDRQRSTKEFEQSILQSLEWTGITPDEEIIYQFDRLETHKQVVEKLLQEGKAYKCFCPELELTAKKEAAIGRQETYQYDKSCRILSQDQNYQDQPYVVRFAVDITGDTFSFMDEIKGEVTIPSVQVDDFIILRSDDTVTYNFAVVQDDHDMKVSHVIRGEDHLLNTVKQILLYQALGYQVPKFAHIPLILGPSGQKMSKRDGSTSVVEYKRDGYLAQALCNYLVRLGWAHGDQEIFTIEEMVKYFSLDGVHKSGAKFDKEKLNWMNSVYIKEKMPEDIFELFKKNLDEDPASATEYWSEQDCLAWIALYQDRVHTLRELYQEIVTAYSLPAAYDWDALGQIIENDQKDILQLLQHLFETTDFEKQILLKAVKELCKEHGYKMAQIAQFLRFVLLGTLSGPSVFDMIILFGKQEVQKRIKKVLAQM